MGDLGNNSIVQILSFKPKIDVASGHPSASLSTSSMHAALRIDEVFLRIVEALDQDTAPSTLSILARTCRAFHEPATDVLWSTQISLGPILRLIPGLEIYVERKSQLRPPYDDLLADLLPAQPSFDHFVSLSTKPMASCCSDRCKCSYSESEVKDLGLTIWLSSTSTQRRSSGYGPPEPGPRLGGVVIVCIAFTRSKFQSWQPFTPLDLFPASHNYDTSDGQFLSWSLTLTTSLTSILSPCSSGQTFRNWIYR